MRKKQKNNKLGMELNLRYLQTGDLGTAPPPGPTNHEMKFNILDSGHAYNAFYIPLI